MKRVWLEFITLRSRVTEMVLESSIILRLPGSADVWELSCTILHPLFCCWWCSISRFTAKCSICYFARALDLCSDFFLGLGLCCCVGLVRKGRNRKRLNTRRSGTNQILDRYSSLFETCILHTQILCVCVLGNWMIIILLNFTWVIVSGSGCSSDSCWLQDVWNHLVAWWC